MKRRLGICLFWLTWPISWVALKGTRRARILVIAEGNILLVRHWHGAGEWSLPGGGMKRHESADSAAVRELREETGISIDAESLLHLGSTKTSAHGIAYMAHLFAVQLPSQPAVHTGSLEIQEVWWCPMNDVPMSEVSADVLRAVRRSRSLV